MPSFGKLKDASQKMMAHVRQPRKQSEESIPLSPGYSSASQQSLLYTSNNNNIRNVGSGSTTSEHRMKKNSTASTQSLARPQSVSFDNPNVVKIRPGQPHGPPPTPKHSLPRLDVDFEHVPFQYYSLITDNPWGTSLLKSVALIVAVLLCPFLVALVVFLFVKCCVINDPKKKLSQEQKKLLNRQFGVACLLTLAKDIVLTGALIQLFMIQNGGPATSWYSNIVYSPIIFVSFMLAAVFPILLFYFASAKYEFGYDVDKKKRSKSFGDFFSSAKTKDDIAQRMTEQTLFFEEEFQLLASIQTYSEEFKFVRQSLSSFLLAIAIILSVMVALGRVAVHVVMHLTSSAGDENLSKGVLVGISTLNALIVSLIAAPYFVYVILWKMALLREWKRFNKNERNTQQTLVNGGPQGIAMWWKIRQTLKMFSESSHSLSAIITKATFVVATVAVLSLSTYLIVVVSSSGRTGIDSIIPAVLLDHVMLYGALLLIGTMTIMADTEKKLSVDIIELKQLNISYELGHLMNLEQEAIEVEPAVKVKVRVIRGCLMLLQELTNNLRHSEKQVSVRMTIFVLVCASLLFLFSTLLALRHLLFLSSSS